jgi:uncharacterized protein YaiI (UPF0178 family)
VTTIFVDGDACPVKGEVERVADRHGLDVVIVSNGGLRPSRNPRVRHVYVPEGADAADDRIVELIGDGDIAITADIPLAARCLEKSARVLGPSGKEFTKDSIGTALSVRALNQAVREATRSETFHAAFSKQDRSRFLSALENAIQSIGRQSSV